LVSDVRHFAHVDVGRNSWRNPTAPIGTVLMILVQITASGVSPGVTRHADLRHFGQGLRRVVRVQGGGGCLLAAERIR
jgi:hypothetical protein